MIRIIHAACALTVAISAIPQPAAAGPEQPGKTPGWYLRQETWQETMRQSREALVRHLEKEAETTVPGGPSGVRFTPWHAIGPFPKPAGNDGWDHAYPPEQEIDPSKRYGKLAWKRETRPDGQWHADIDLPGHSSIYMFRTIKSQRAQELGVYLGCDDRFKVWLNGQLVSSCEGVPRDREVKLPLKAGENRLLVKLYNVSGGKGYSFSLTKNSRPGQRNENDPESILWRSLARDFNDPTARQQIRWEREDGIWTGGWKAGEFRELVDRYATATRATGSENDESGSPSRKADSAADLRVVREIYHRSRRIEDALRMAGELDLGPLRLAITDLMQSFGKRYPDGQGYLDRLAQIEELRKGALETAGTDPDVLVRVTDEFRALRSEALLANPLLDFEKLLLVKRRGNLGLPQNWQGNCVFRGGFDNEIAVLSSLQPGAGMTTLYRPESGGFVGDVDLHWDAERMLFSMRTKTGRYEVFEIGTDGAGLRQVTPAEPDVDNYDACYLPSDKIIYDSTACFQGVPCVGGGNQVANLHVINPDGTGIRRICFDQDHDWCPSVTNDGRVIFTRWEYSDTPHYFTRVVMSMNPDGTNQKSVYGSNSYWPNSTFYPRSIPGHPSRFVGIVSGHHGVPRMGELILFDPSKGQHEADGVVQRIPGHGEKVEPIIRDQLVNNSWPRFLHPYPLSGKYFLTACQPDVESPWGIYLVDVFDNILPICVEPGVALFEPVPLRKTPRPPVIPERVDPERKDAVVYLADIHKGGGLKGVAPGTAKKLRLYAFDYGYQGLANHTYIGIEGPWDVHRILGTVDIEKDGSSAFRIPANTPVAVQPLDEDGKALQLMRSWFVAMPGESLSCTGCHEKESETPPSQAPIAMVKSPQDIRPWFGPARGFSFDREVQPVLDRHCIGCHNDKPHDGRQLSDLRQDDVRTFSRAYQVLQKYVRRPGPESDYHMFPPAEYHADTSPLIQMLEKGHHGVKLDREASERLYTWIDLNVPYYGTWGEFRDIPKGQRQRRAELRSLHAGVDEDYEVIPELSVKPIQAIIPHAPAPARVVAIDCPGWPFDDKAAHERQGKDRDRTVTLQTNEQKKLQLSLVQVPAGEFVMGDSAGAPDEGPPCRVKIDQPFWITKQPVTNELFALFDPGHDSRYLDRNGKDHSNRGRPLNQPHQPVIRVSWGRAMAFCEWLSEQTGQRYSLPTEAQWEFACRGGAPAIQAGGGRAWGIDHMPGEVAEWTRSAYRPYPYSAGDGRDDCSRQDRKVVRGAKAISLPNDRRDTYRLSYHWWQGVWDVGFRVVCLDEEPNLATASPTR